jgi:hypothetical protein
MPDAKKLSGRRLLPIGAPRNIASLNERSRLQVKCHRCETEAIIPLEHARRPRDTPIWKLEAALKCRSCRTPRYSPRVHMIKLTQQREIAPYKWVHPDDDERR